MNVFKLAFYMAVAVAVILFAKDALAHFSPGGMEYPKDCCNATECAPINSEYITEDAENFYLNMPAGSHHNMKKAYRKVFKKFNLTSKGQEWSSRIKWATDGEHHACCGTTQCYCIIVPPRGF